MQALQHLHAEQEEYEKNKRTMSKNELRQLALDLRRQNPEFQALHSQVAQQVADRFYQARERFLGGLANKPKKKKPLKYLSLVYPQSGWKLSDTREVGLGKNKKKKARLKQNRLLYPSDTQGVPRESGVPGVRQALPLWSNLRFLVEEAEAEEEQSENPKKAVGVDLGITRLATLSDGRYLENPKPLERSLDRVRLLQRTLSRKRFLSKTGLKQRLAKEHEHIKDFRCDSSNLGLFFHRSTMC